MAQRLDQGLAKVAGLPEFTRGADREPPKPVLGPAVTVSWHGDAVQLLRSVALARGKELKVLGPKPHLPLIVHIDVTDVPYDEFLRDIGYQFGQRADLVLADGHIEIRYRAMP